MLSNYVSRIVISASQVEIAGGREFLEARTLIRCLFFTANRYVSRILSNAHPGVAVDWRNAIIDACGAGFPDINSLDATCGALPFAPDAQSLYEEAFQQAHLRRSPIVGVEHLLMAAALAGREHVLELLPALRALPPGDFVRSISDEMDAYDMELRVGQRVTVASGERRDRVFAGANREALHLLLEAADPARLSTSAPGIVAVENGTPGVVREVDEEAGYGIEITGGPLSGKVMYVLLSDLTPRG